MGVTGYKKLSTNKTLNNRLMKAAEKLDIKVHLETIHSSDVFYRENPAEFEEIYAKHDAVCVEMESFALFANAKALNKKAACILTISDSLVTKEVTSSEERQSAFKEMMLIALNSI